MLFIMFLMLVLAAMLTPHTMAFDNATSPLSAIDSYGNWCGGGHGGLQDCCSGGKCPSCDFNKGITQACLDECPAIDGMDMACVKHDFCCFQHDKQISCSPQGNYCQCDCELVKTAEGGGICSSTYCKGYAKGLQTTFKKGTSCFTGTGSNQQCHKRPVGDELYAYC